MHNKAKKYNKNTIKNNFLDFISFFISFLFSFFRSILLFFGKKNLKVKNYFFGFLDFIFRIWPRYFWKKPTGLKLTRFLGDLVNNIFLKR